MGTFTSFKDLAEKCISKIKIPKNRQFSGRSEWGTAPVSAQSYTMDTMLPRKRQINQARATESPETDPYVIQTWNTAEGRADQWGKEGPFKETVLGQLSAGERGESDPELYCTTHTHTAEPAGRKPMSRCQKKIEENIPGTLGLGRRY